MTAEQREPRVLLGPLGPLVRLGVSSTLSMHGRVEIVGDEDESDAAVRAAGRLAPDVIILGGSSDASPDLRKRLRRVAPKAKLIFCPTDERIEVLDPGTSRTRLCSASAAESLHFELSPPANAQE